MNVSTLLIQDTVSHINESIAFTNSFSTALIALNYLQNSCNDDAYSELLQMVNSGSVEEREPLYIITEAHTNQMYFFKGDAEVKALGLNQIGRRVIDVHGYSHTWYLNDPYHFLAIDLEKAVAANNDLEYNTLQLTLSKMLVEDPFNLPDYCLSLNPVEFIQHLNKQPMGYLRIMLLK